MTITISISEEATKALQARAQSLGIKVEDLARIELERSATAISPAFDEDFRRAADYVLKKDAELLKRLA